VSAVSVSAAANGAITLASNRYGSNSGLSLQGSAASSVLGDGQTSTTVRTGAAGQNLVGTINGQPAVCFGQSMMGATGDASEGLKFKVLGGSTGARGQVQYSLGFSAQLDQLASSFLGENGVVTLRQSAINSSQTRISADMLRQQSRLTMLQKQYTTQFNKLDVTMSSMNSTTSFLTQQLAALAKSA
jgi:flagellar hook-associated protein 2